MTKNLTHKMVTEDLKKTLKKLLDETDRPNLTNSARRVLENEIREVVSALTRFLNELDPIKQPTSIFDPANPKVVGRFIALALVAQQRYPLNEATRFYGSGIYAIYYKGKYPLYAPISGSETPIYVGQAAPAINNARTPQEQGDRLSRRLGDHRKNIGLAKSTLNLDDFEYRSLVIQSGWETAAEDYLIHLFHPIWNSETNIIYGLGKHGDDSKTRANKRSPWDTLHPGRPWAIAKNIPDAKNVENIKKDTKLHFQKYQVLFTVKDILANFIEELRQV
jgi:hypothetical protein